MAIDLDSGRVRERTAAGIRRLFRSAAAVCLVAASPAALAQNYALLSGAELFEQFCSACHGPEGHGDGPVARSLAVRVPDLTRLYERHGDRFPAAEVREIIDGRSLVIAHGTRYMPVWGYEFWLEEGGDVVAEEEARLMIDRLVAYLRSIQAGPDSAAAPR